ncbi:MAG TPA: DegT/DnrJ/EryC1/StrS family aminotransferase [Candidatus Acidoferrales bacterium]|nr:DegT/DnrJ/EryC1/StrS family aminotransferase [Candidatus Acidoferrales bacterium]
MQSIDTVVTKASVAKRSIPFGKPIIEEEERAAVMEVLAGPILVHGPRATTFENDFAAYTGAPHAVTVSSCTAGMHLVWFTLGLGPGDEVIVPAQTHVASAHAVELTGAKAVFVDAEPATGNIDVTAIAGAITARTKAIVVVHYLGMPVDMVSLVELARKHKLFVLEDCALAIGTKLDGIHAGLHGDAGVFSFYPVKHMTTAEGGMIITRDADLAARLRLRKAFGVDRTHGERKIPGAYDVVALGFNYRMNEIQAAIGSAQLKKMGGFLAARERNYRTLSKALAGARGIGQLRSTQGRFRSSYYCLSIVLDTPLAPKRADVIARLNAEGIGTSVYYPQPVPRMTYYRDKYGWQEGAFPVAARISDCSIALPVGPHLAVDDMNYIATHVQRVAKEAAG